MLSILSPWHMTNTVKRFCAATFLVLAMWQFYAGSIKFSVGESYALRLTTGVLFLIAAALVLRNKQHR